MNKRGLLNSNPIMLLIVFLLLSFLILSLVDANSITGYAATKIKKSICVDSDNGRNIYIIGTVIKGSTIKKDSCSGSSVKEGYCENGSYKYKLYKCTKGCSNGACIK